MGPYFRYILVSYNDTKRGTMLLKCFFLPFVVPLFLLYLRSTVSIVYSKLDLFSRSLCHQSTQLVFMQKRKDELLKKIQEEFNISKWKTAQYISKGYDHDVIILDKKMIFRFPKKGDSIEMLKDEITLLQFLSSHIDAQIPHYTHVSKDKSFAAYPILLGREMRKYRYQTLSKKDKLSFAKQVAQFLNQLLGFDIKKIKKFHVHRQSPQKNIKNLQNNVKKYLFPHFDKKEQICAQKFLQDLQSVVKESEKYFSLIHSDLSEDHILWDEKKKKISILDFSDREIGDRAGDFAGLFVYGPKFVKEVLSQYHFSDDTLFERAKLYFYRCTFFIMVDAYKMKRWDKRLADIIFQSGYKMFLQRFKL